MYRGSLSLTIVDGIDEDRDASGEIAIVKSVEVSKVTCNCSESKKCKKYLIIATRDLIQR